MVSSWQTVAISILVQIQLSYFLAEAFKLPFLPENNQPEPEKWTPPAPRIQPGAVPSPLILVPGLAASRLAGQLHKDSVVRSFCSKERGKHIVWPPLDGFLPFIFDCWLDNVKLHFNKETGEISDPPGVNITVPGFGKTEKLEYLLDVKLGPLAYFNEIVQTAVKHWGYQRSVSIRAAPYDFRKVSPDFEIDYHLRLKNLIEETYATNHKNKITLLCHSLGCLVTLRFLQVQNEQWKQKFIKDYVVIGAPYGGSIGAIKSIASGCNFGFSHIPNLKMREAERTWPSMHLLVPSTKTGIEDYPLVKTQNKVYTTHNLKELYDDLDPEMWPLYEKSTENYEPLKGPGVRAHCLYGTGVQTEFSLVYGKNHHFPDDQPLYAHTIDGDDTVPSRSASLCAKWSETQSEEVHHRGFANATHVVLLRDHRVIDYLYSVIFKEHSLLEDQYLNNNGIGFGFGDLPTSGLIEPNADESKYQYL